MDKKVPSGAEMIAELSTAPFSAEVPRVRARGSNRVSFRFRWLVWTLVLACLPITTPPFLRLGTTVAKPLSALPAFLIVALLLTREGRKFKNRVAKESRILFVFMTYTLISGSFLAAVQDQQLAKGFTPLGIFVRGWVSLLVGVGFYVAFRLIVVTRVDLKLTELLLLFAVAMSSLWAVVQFISVKLMPGILPVVDQITAIFVDRAAIWNDRFHGFAYEPSWLASQITLLIVPVAFSRLVSGQSLGAIRFASARLSFELLVLVAGILGLVTTGSRTGIVALIVMLAAGLLTVLLGTNRFRAYLRALGVIFIVLATVPVLLRQPLVETTIQEIAQAESPQELAVRAHAGPRVAAWQAAWDTFLDHPILGVGIGNSSRYFAQHVPFWAISEREVVDLLSRQDSRPNPKNMALRLLSETGLIGFVIFALFLWQHFRSRGRGTIRYRVLRNMAAVALAINYFSLDTFSLPTEWFLLGIVLMTRRLDVAQPNARERPFDESRG